MTAVCVPGIGENYYFVFSTEMRFSLWPNRSYTVNAKSSYIQQEKVRNSTGSETEPFTSYFGQRSFANSLDCIQQLTSHLEDVAVPSPFWEL